MKPGLELHAPIIVGVMALTVSATLLMAKPADAAAPGQVALDFALAQVGDPYRYGGSGPNGWDCSGLTQAAWRTAGKAIPRTSRSQYANVPSVRVDAVRPGDLLFAYRPVGHVGMYVGNGHWVHAPNSGGAVEVVPVPWNLVVGAGRPR